MSKDEIVHSLAQARTASPEVLSEITTLAAKRTSALSKHPRDRAKLSRLSLDQLGHEQHGAVLCVLCDCA